MKKLHIYMAAALLLIGAGCRGAGERAADEALKPITVPINALNQSKEVMEQAKANEDADALADNATVALILTEGAAVPAGAKVGDTIGCNDRVALAEVPKVGPTGAALKDALTALFAVKDKTYDGFYNALGYSSLSVDKIQSRDGATTEVWLKGQVQSGGVCDDPRIKAQIEATIKRLKPKSKIFLNGTESAYRCLGDLKGDCQ